MTKGIDYPGVTVGCIIYKPLCGILFVHRTAQCRDERHTRDIVGGGVDVGDTFMTTVTKEINEEVGLTIDPSQATYLGHREQFRKHGDKQTHWIGFYYLVVLTGDQEPCIMEPHKFDDMRFFPLDDLPTQDVSHSVSYVAVREYLPYIQTLI